MAAVILGARSWDCGNKMLNTVDDGTGGWGRVTVSNTNPHTGTYCLSIADINLGSSPWCRWAISGTPANPSVSVWYDPASMFESADAWLRFLLGTGEYIDLRWDPANHTFDAYVDGVKVADGAIEVSTNDWLHVQFYVVVDHAGSIGVRINGHQSIDYSGDTQPGAGTGATYFYVHLDGVTNKGCRIDDLVWGYGDYLGDLRCVDIRPNADTAQDDWTPSVGDNYSTVDETPENDADYNETNTNAHADELALDDFDDTLMTPRAVVAYVRARMEGAFGDSLKVGIVSNAVEVTTTHALSTAYEYYTHTADEDPNGPIAWTDAAVDALLLRYEAAIA